MTDTQITDPEVEQLKLYKEAAYAYRERRDEDWRENYTLYRDKVVINRLTQRQSVHVPLMKQTIRTLLKDIDDMPVIYMKNLDNDSQAEIFLNEYWKWTLDMNKMELQDIIDKKQVLLFGRTFNQMQIEDGVIKMRIQDTSDILVDRYVDPANIDTARYLIHVNIFKPLSYIQNNDKYDQKAVKKLVAWHATEQGLIRAAGNEQMSQNKDQRMVDIGVVDVDQPKLGETLVELNQFFVYDKAEGSDTEELFLKVVADDYVVLMSLPLDQVIGKTEDDYWKTHFPYDTWADDLEKQDFWCDGVGDIMRTPNKIVDTWESQLAENRTMRNFGMHYYNSSLEDFRPSTFKPVGWGWYPIPAGIDGDITKVMQKVDIPDLSDSLDELHFVIETSEKASGATATQQGAQTQRRVTLGEVELALGEAKERIKGMSKFYTTAWKDRAEKFLKLIEAAPEKLDAVKIYKEGRNTDTVYEREIAPTDWMTKSGYKVRIWAQDEKDANDTKSLERLSVARANIPNNPKLDTVYKRKLLEFASLNPDEINEIIEYGEEQRALMMNQAQGLGQPMGQPVQQLPMQQQNV